MARFIQAIVAFGPKVELGKIVETEELADLLAQRSGLHAGQTLLALSELEATLTHFLRSGRSVRLNGIGIFTPTVGMDGQKRIRYRSGTLLRRILDQGAFRGTVRNAEASKLTPEDYKRLWDEAHPEDPLELPRRRAA